MDDSAATLRLAATACRNLRDEFADVLRMSLDTAPYRRSVAAATSTYRQAFVPVADRLANPGAMRAGMDVTEAVGVLRFFLATRALSTCATRTAGHTNARNVAL
jgi:hypothetical protein